MSTSVELNTKGLDKFQNLLKTELKDLQVGVFDGKYPDGQTVPQVAFWNEYGTKKIQERPFMRQTANKKNDIKNIVVDVMKKDLERGTISWKKIGLGMVDLMRKTIQSGTFAALAVSTVLRKQSRTPLIHTGEMLKRVRYRLK